MKHIKYAILSLLLIFIFSFPVVAAEPETEPEVSTGRFNWDEYSKNLEAQKVDKLTKEQEDAGWILYNGYAYPPESAEGEASSIKSNIISDPSIKTGSITFKVEVDSNIHQGVFIEITNTQDYAIYQYPVFESNKYCTSVNVPVGTYIISDGGLQNDYKSEYKISKKTFEVKENVADVVTVKITKASLQEERYKQATKEEDKLNNPVPIKSENKQIKKSIFGIIEMIIALILIVFLIIYLRKKKEEKLQ